MTLYGQQQQQVAGKFEDSHRQPNWPQSQLFMSDVAVRHSVALSDLQVHHFVDVSPGAVSIAREVRFCVIALVVGWTTKHLISVLLDRRTPDSEEKE